MLITILALVFVLGIAIIVHEFGHFIVAKKAGIFVKTFCIGFGRKLIKKKYGETVYAIAVIPFGGYVKFAGELEDSDQKEAPQGDSSDEVPDSEIDPERYFVNQSTLIRSAVVFAGPLMNFILAFAVYVGMYSVDGLRVSPTTQIGEVTAGSFADSVGIQVNDEILAVNGAAVETWGDLVNEVLKDKESIKRVEVARAGQTLEFDFKLKISDKSVSMGIQPFVSTEIGQVKRDAPAYKVGMRTGAFIEAINDTATTTFYQIERIIHANPEVPLVVQWSMNNVSRIDTITPQAKQVPKDGSQTELKTVGQIGVGPFYKKERVAVHKAASMGAATFVEMVVAILSFLKLLLAGEAGVDTLGGPILIGQMAGDMARWGFDYLMYFLAFLSINLGIFNLLPILPFDGGHLTMFFYETLTRRRVNKRLREVLAQAGFVLLILLMVFVVFNDLRRLFGSSPGLF